MLLRSFLILLILAFSIISARAEDAFIGYVKTAQGEASIVRGKQVIPARINEQISRKDVLQTGAKSSLGVALKDDTLIALGANSQVIISEYDFSPGEGKLMLFTKMLKGCVEFASGIIGKLSPETVRFSTPVGDISLRGTHFAVWIAD